MVMRTNPPVKQALGSVDTDTILGKANKNELNLKKVLKDRNFCENRAFYKLNFLGSFELKLTILVIVER